MQTVRVAVLRAAQEAQVRDGRGVEEVLQAAQHHAGAVDVARLQFPHRLDHGQRNLVLICGFRTASNWNSLAFRCLLLSVNRYEYVDHDLVGMLGSGLG